MSNLDNFKEYEGDFQLKDLWHIISEYKWLIFFITTLAFIVININLYFEPPIYSSYSIIEVKSSSNKENKTTDDLLQNVFNSNYRNINKEIEILKTYRINKKVIDKMNVKTQFFMVKNYKTIEIYGDDVPIRVDNIEIYDNQIIGKMIKVIPRQGFYRLEVESPKMVDRVLKFFDRKKPLISSDLTPYGEEIRTKYFKLSITKLKDTNQTILFKINGNSREVYESIINNNLSIEQLNKDTSLIKISYEDSVPERSTDYINNLVNIFIWEEKQSRDKKGDEILQFIEKQLKSVKRRVDELEHRLENYKVENNIINLSSQSNVIINKLSNIEIEISKYKMTEFFINSALRAIQEDRDFESILVILTRLKDDRILSNINTLNRLKQEERSLMGEYTEKYPKLIKIRNEIQGIEKNLFANIQTLKEFILSRVKDLHQEKWMYEKRLLAFPKKEIVQINLQSQYDINSQLYLYLLKKKEEKRMINMALTAISDYKIIEKAYVPKSSIKQKRSMTILSFTFVGFIIALTIALCCHALNGNIKDLNKIKRNKKWLFAMEIPQIKGKKGEKIEVFENPQSPFTESYRRLRTDLEFLLKSNKASIILVTSTLPKEGKSTVVINLGAIFQLTGFRKSIIVDLDLERPLLHRYFDMESDIGVSSYLNGSVNISDILFPTNKPNLDIIPVGLTPINPSELLLSDRLQNLFNKLREKYHYIIINAPSIAKSSDTISLTRYSDLNLFVFKRAFSKKRFISQLEAIISKYDLDKFGLIMNGSIKKGIDYV